MAALQYADRAQQKPNFCFTQPGRISSTSWKASKSLSVAANQSTASATEHSLEGCSDRTDVDVAAQHD